MSPGLANERFVPAWPWFGGNLQTLADRIRPSTYRLDDVGTEVRDLVRVEDGTPDRLSVRVHQPLAPQPDRPMVLIVHGMGGTVESPYVRATASGLLRAGYPVARVDLRGAGESAEHSTSLYHGGRTADLRAVLRALTARHAASGVAVVGFSLGGNLTLKLAGEPLEGLDVRAAAAVCAPIDLSSAVEHISRRMFGIYGKFFVHRLREDTLAAGLRLTPAERAALAQIRTIVGFDDLITAKHNGWPDAAAYYAANSSAQFLPRIDIPTLVVHALDDPMIPADSYRAVDWGILERTTPVRRAITPTGGHVGFHEQGAALPWYVERIRAFLDEV